MATSSRRSSSRTTGTTGTRTRGKSNGRRRASSSRSQRSSGTPAREAARRAQPNPQTGVRAPAEPPAPRARARAGYHGWLAQQYLFQPPLRLGEDGAFIHRLPHRARSSSRLQRRAQVWTEGPGNGGQGNAPDEEGKAQHPQPKTGNRNRAFEGKTSRSQSSTG